MRNMAEEEEKIKEQQSSSVLVLLSTHNGEKYIREQLDSILQQKGCRTTLLVRDDGSTDTTREILREYQQGAFGNQFYAVLEEENVGVVRSFFRLLCSAADLCAAPGKYEDIPLGRGELHGVQSGCSSQDISFYREKKKKLAEENSVEGQKFDYYALADQDDIWLEDKLSAAVAMIREKERKAKRKKVAEGNTEKTAEAYECLPCLYAGAVQPVDQRGRNIPAGIRYPKRRPSFGNALVENICPGCTCVMNRQLLLMAGGTAEAMETTVLSRVLLHDFWLYLLAGAFGNVIFDEQPHILYRQHGNNSVGMASTLLESYLRRVRNFRKNRGKLKGQAITFERLYGLQLREWDEEKAALLRDFSAGKRRLFLDRRLYRQRRSDSFIVKVLLLLGWL